MLQVTQALLRGSQQYAPVQMELTLQVRTVSKSRQNIYNKYNNKQLIKSYIPPSISSHLYSTIISILPIPCQPFLSPSFLYPPSILHYHLSNIIFLFFLSSINHILHNKLIFTLYLFLCSLPSHLYHLHSFIHTLYLLVELVDSYLCFFIDVFDLG